MRRKTDDNEIIILSFLIGLLTFFALKERRIDTFKRKMNQTTPGENIKKDWMTIGSDLKKSFNKIVQEKGYN